MNQKRTNQQNQVINILMEQDDFITSTYISQVLGVSSKSIRMILKELMRDTENAVFKIEMQKSKGYKLRITDAKKFAKVAVDDNWDIDFNSQNMRTQYILNKLLENNLVTKTITQQALSELLMVSLTTLKKDIQVVKNRLAFFSIVISFDNSGLYLTGSEENIRACMSKYYLSLQAVPTNNFICGLFDNREYLFVNSTLIETLRQYDIVLSDLALNTITIHILVMVLRIRNNGSISQILPLTNPQPTALYEQATTTLLRIFSECFELSFSEEEHLYLYNHLLSCQRQDSIKLVEGRRTNPLIVTLVEGIIGIIMEKLQLDFSKDTELFYGLVIHMETLLQRLEFERTIENELLTTIKKNYPFAFQLALVAALYLEKELQKPLQEEEIGYLAVHFGAALARIGQERKQQYFTASIICGTGIGTALLVKERIREQFGNQIKIIDCFALHEVERQSLNRVDLVLSTIPLPFDIKHTIFVKNLLNESEIKQIKKKLHGRNMIAPEIKSLFDPRLFLQEKQKISKAEVLEKMIATAVDVRNLDAETIASIYNRERLASSEIGNLIAIPHPIDNYSPSSFVSLMVLDHAVKWDELYVQIIVMIVVNKADIAAWEEIFMAFIHYLTKENGLKKMVESPNYEMFLERFIRKEF